MDPAKINAILEWESLTKVTKLRFFLSLVNYYRLFIKGYCAIATLFTDLLKKRRGWAWSQECQEAFNALKKAISEKHAHSLPNLNKPFKLHTNACNFAVSGVLM